MASCDCKECATLLAAQAVLSWLASVAGSLAGAGHVDRAHMVCVVCNSAAVANESNMYVECAALTVLAATYSMQALH